MFKNIYSNLKLFLKTKKKVLIILSFLTGIIAVILNTFITLNVLNLIIGISILILFYITISIKIKLFNIKNEQKLKPNHLEIIIDSMNESVIIYTPNFKIINFNKAAEKLFNIKKEEVINRNISPAFINNKKFKILAQVMFPSLSPKVVQLSDKNWPQITEITTQNNLILTTIFSKTTDEKNNSTSFIKIIQDKTSERQLLENKTEFITNSAHQLKIPIESINKIFKNIAKNGLEQNKKNIEQGINLSGKSLKTIRDLLNVSQFENSQYKYNFQKINIVDIIKKTIEKANIIAREYNISISLKYSEEPTVKVDLNKITDVLSTLIDNAIKYNNKNGSITIYIEKNMGFAEIIISDTGIGIKKEHLNKIFNKFYRTERGIKHVPDGSGFGLYIAKKIINKHGGKMWVSSILKRGSDFHFTLPLYK